MARDMKVFGIIMACSNTESDLLGLPSHSRQIRAVVAAQTKKEAQAKFGITAGEANGFMGETGNNRELEIALSKPGQVFACALNAFHDKREFIEIERKPHIPMKRIKRPTYEQILANRQKNDEKAAREFSNDELEYLADMLAGANNPLGASIAHKARLHLDAQ